MVTFFLGAAGGEPMGEWELHRNCDCVTAMTGRTVAEIVRGGRAARIDSEVSGLSNGGMAPVNG